MNDKVKIAQTLDKINKNFIELSSTINNIPDFDFTYPKLYNQFETLRFDKTIVNEIDEKYLELDEIEALNDEIVSLLNYIKELKRE